MEQAELLAAFLLAIAEVLVVSRAQMGDDADGGLYDALQGAHLAGFADACLEDAELCLLREAPYGKRYANL